MRPLSTLRGRLAAAAAASILAAVLLFALVTVLVVDHELRGSLDSALRQRAEEVAQLAVSAPAVLTYPGALEQTASGRQIVVEVLDAHGRILAHSLGLGAGVLPEDRLARAALARGRPGAEDIALGGRPFRVYAAPIADAGGAAAGGAVLVASDTSDISHTLSSLGAAVALSGGAIVLLAGIAAAVLTRRGLRPLRRLAEAAGEIERTADPARRLPDPGAGEEIAQLTGVLNRMLASLEQARAGERRFLADASHELRTPVTTLLGNAEYAARHGADAEVVAELRDGAQRLARLVDALLALERAGAAGERFSSEQPAPVAIEDLIAAAVKPYGGDRVRVGALAAAAVAGDRDALARAISNLIENGLVHGPPNGVVVLGARTGEAQVRISVRDAGAGPDPSARERLFERFWRGPEAAERPGSGLGLSIAAAIARAHGGSIEVEGSEFVLVLPLAGS